MGVQPVKASQSCVARRSLPELMLRGALLSCLALILGLAAGCGSADTAAPSRGAPAALAEGATPMIRLVAPEPGSVLAGPSVRVEVAISGFIIDPAAVGKASAPGRGHWHLYLNGAFLVASTELQHTLNQVPPGPHHLRVSLANNDHSPLDPPVEDSLVIDVKGTTVRQGDVDGWSY